MIQIKSYGSGSKGNCYLVSNEKCKILLECGFDIKYIMKKLLDDNIKISQLDCVIISHAHKDHSLSIHDFHDYFINVYCTEQTIKKFNLSGVCQISKFENINLYAGSNEISILPIPVKHGDCECYGFIFHDKDSTILFLTDFMLLEYDLSSFKFDEIYIETNYCENRVNEALKNADESEWYKIKRQINTHCSVENAITYLKHMDLSRCKKICGIHLSNNYSNAKEIVFKIQNEFGIPTFIINRRGEVKNG